MEIQRFEDNDQIKTEVRDKFNKVMAKEFELLKAYTPNALIKNHAEEFNEKVIIDTEKVKNDPMYLQFETQK